MRREDATNGENMKYEALMCQLIRKTITVEAANRDEAFRKVHADTPGFTSDSVAEVDEDGEVTAEHFMEGTCENCDELIWDGEKYFTGAEDGIKLCESCFQATESENK